MEKNHNRVIDLFYRNWIYVIEFVFFAYLLYLVPYINDRMMERGLAYRIESSFRYLVSQKNWIEAANARVLSNVFSYVVDRNRVVHAIANSMMITGSSFLMYRIVCKNENQILKIMSAVSVVIVGARIKQEVYYYACTLYMSAVLISLCVVYFIFKQVKTTNERKFLYILVLIGAIWIENLSVGLCCFTGMLLVWNVIHTHKINRNSLYCFVISLLGLLFMLVVNLQSSNSRLTGTLESKWSFQILVDDLYVLLYDNSVIICLFSFAVITILIQNLKKKKQMWSAWLICGAAIICFSMMVPLVADKMLNVLMTNPADGGYSSFVLGWKALELGKWKTFFFKFQRFMLRMVIEVIALLFILLLYVAFYLKRVHEIIPLIVFAIGSLSIYVMQGERGGRVTVVAVFLFILLMLYAFNMIKIRKNQFAIIGMIVSIIVCDDMYIFIHNQNKIEKKRDYIATTTRNNQMLGEWDYDEYVVVPPYTPDGAGKRLFVFPINANNPYYDVFLNYYDLDKRTKVVFSESAEPLIVEISKAHERVTLFMDDNREEGKYLYRFIDNETGENSGWIKDKRIDISSERNLETPEELDYSCEIRDEITGEIERVDYYTLWYDD